MATALTESDAGVLGAPDLTSVHCPAASARSSSMAAAVASSHDVVMTTAAVSSAGDGGVGEAAAGAQLEDGVDGDDNCRATRSPASDPAHGWGGERVLDVGRGGEESGEAGGARTVRRRLGFGGSYPVESAVVLWMGRGEGGGRRRRGAGQERVASAPSDVQLLLRRSEECPNFVFVMSKAE